MPQAPAYNRARDFATQSGSATDNAGINAELDSISLSINAQRSNSAILQRDDGGLKDAVVGVNALSRETLNLIGGLVYRGVWSANTAYQSKDIVSNAGMLYVCSVAHTSPATFVELPNWKAFGFAGSSEAALSAAQAAASASASANSAADALTSKNAAATSATNAASSASAALSSKNDAAASASASSLSKDSAANSATASANSANGITVSATGLAAGASPTVTKTGTAPSINVAFGIPKGDKGDTGLQGPSFGGHALFKTPGTFSWTCPEGVTTVYIDGCGGGGGGGGAFYLDTNTRNSGGGGGGGGSVAGFAISVMQNATYQIVVGGGGAGGSGSTVANSGLSGGSSGGATTFASLLTLSGGSGGGVNYGNNPQLLNGGTGGSAPASSGIEGGNGGHGEALGLVVCFGGVGGSTLYGSSVSRNYFGSRSSIGYGCGGCGGCSMTITSYADGGKSGNSGFLKISWGI